MIFYLIAVVMFAISVTVYEIISVDFVEVYIT